MQRIALDGFALDVPDNWSSRLLALVGPREEFGRGEASFQSNVVVAVERLEEPTDLAIFVEDQAQSLKKDLGGYRELNREQLQLAGQPAYVIEFTFLSPDGVMLRQMNCYRLLGKQRVLVLNASHLMGKRFDQARAGFMEIFKSLRVKRPGGPGPRGPSRKG